MPEGRSYEECATARDLLNQPVYPNLHSVAGDWTLRNYRTGSEKGTYMFCSDAVDAAKRQPDWWPAERLPETIV